jgi:homoserine kinase type II
MRPGARCRRPSGPALPVLCRGAALRFLLTRLFDWVHTPPGALVTRKDPMEYLHKLRFFRQAANAEAIGA